MSLSESNTAKVEALDKVYKQMSDSLTMLLSEYSTDGLDNYLYASGQGGEWTYRDLRRFSGLLSQAVVTRLVDAGYLSMVGEAVATPEEIANRKSKPLELQDKDEQSFPGSYL